MDDGYMSGEALYALTIHRLTSSIVIGDLSFLSMAVQGAVFLLGVGQLEKLLNTRSSRKPVKGLQNQHDGLHVSCDYWCHLWDGG